MSNLADLTRPPNALRMPKGKDSAGIHFEGVVLTGEKSLSERRLDDALEVSNASLTGSSPFLEVIPSHLRPPGTRYKPIS